MTAPCKFLRAPIGRVTARNLPIGSIKPLEDQILPAVEDIVRTVLRIGRHGRTLTSPPSLALLGGGAGPVAPSADLAVGFLNVAIRS